MLFKNVALLSTLLACGAVYAENTPSYQYVEGSVERISQSGEDSFSETGFGVKTAWQISENWFIGAKWDRFSSDESESESFDNERFNETTELTLDRYYLGAGYIIPVSDVSNISVAAYLGSYRISAKTTVSAFIDDQQILSESYSGNSTENSVKLETLLRSNISEQLEVSAKVFYEYLNMSQLDNKSQYGIGVGAQYHLGTNLALTADATYGKVLDENTTQLGLGLRYNF
ncbi:outer membrane beta-barrel protein [Rheinheimera baltica]|uniref:outer membrane beta-barrel protein n=1 Tax=Rheinheimera baltica TaxID=67576 RepID=UPI00273D2224|nr:outer membrane beta-barrel protein [Rheinheimera baltica]MDP5189715.1 outer membrane beta-barrel protein [Rheinheimera baltica]